MARYSCPAAPFGHFSEHLTLEGLLIQTPFAADDNGGYSRVRIEADCIQDVRRPWNKVGVEEGP